jgi:hypothetical protein
MKRQVRIFVEGRELDLFSDETIEVNSTIQNIQDISKTFTDFSQSFTIPTSARNNAVWEYFYENAVNSSINYQERLDGYIEIDMTFFRRGKIQMEKSQLKNGQPNSYTITFYGDVTTLKDLVGEDLLSNLDYSTVNHDYTFTEVVTNRVINYSVDWDVCYPLITSNRIWEFRSTAPVANVPNWLVPFLGSTSNDIHTNAGAINYRELFPALRVKSIFDIIGLHYGITFNGAFLTDPKFTQAYLWYKNKNDFEFVGQSNDLDITTLSYQQPIAYFDLTTAVDVTNNTITTSYIQVPTGINHKITYKVTSVSSSTIPYFIDTYLNGALFSTTQGVGVANYVLATTTNPLGLQDVWRFELRASFALTINSQIEYEFLYIIAPPIPQTDLVRYNCGTLNLLAKTDLAQLAPQMKVQDFISGILKQFNLTCYGSGVNEYTVIPLEDWYATGAIIDITEFTDKTEIGIDRVKLYKKIGFAFEQSNSLMNKAYFEQGLKEYGNTEYQYPYDGGEFTIKVPFENLLFNQFTHTGTPTGLQVGYSLDSSYSPYIPKPCLLYKYGGITLAPSNHIKFTSGVGHTTTHDYTMFGQDLTDNGINYSTNFAPETSSYWLFPIQQSIFATYYFPYLTNLFNPKNRLTTVKTNLPVGILTNLRLNDRLIIRDKRYLINEMKTNLVTGESTFQLLNDFMPLFPLRVIQTGEAQDEVTVPITLPNFATLINFTSPNTGVILTPTSITASQTLRISLPPIIGDIDRATEDAQLRITEGGIQLETEGRNDVISVDCEYIYQDGSTQTSQIVILR